MRDATFLSTDIEANKGVFLCPRLDRRHDGGTTARARFSPVRRLPQVLKEKTDYFLKEAFLFFAIHSGPRKKARKRRRQVSTGCGGDQLSGIWAQGAVLNNLDSYEYIHCFTSGTTFFDQSSETLNLIKCLNRFSVNRIALS